MQNFGQNNIPKTNILTELSGGNVELGEAFALILNDMVVQSGITNPKAEIFEIVGKSWKNIAQKSEKTKEEIEKLDKELFSQINILAKSYLLFIAKNVQNTTGKLDYEQYEKYMLKFRFGHYDIMNKPEYINKVKVQIRNAFNKISSHGEKDGDNIIDKDDMAAYIYALATKVQHNENGGFGGFIINGDINPENYALSESNLFDSEENLMSVKLRMAYKILNGKL